MEAILSIGVVEVTHRWRQNEYGGAEAPPSEAIELEFENSRLRKAAPHVKPDRMILNEPSREETDEPVAPTDPAPVRR